MLKDFKEFAMRGNVVDMAVGIIIGASFGGIVKSLVDDVIMPPIGLILGNVDFSNLYLVLKDGNVAGPYSALVEAKKAGAVTINYGVFANAVISFLIVAFSVFLLVRALNKLKRESTVEVTTRECPECLSVIALKARKCPHCCSELAD
jgi:large conductance mechanosensitive channel